MASVPKVKDVCQVPTPQPSHPGAIPDIIPNRLPGGGISILAGAPNIGKTALLSTMLRDLRDGRPIFGHQPQPISAIGMVNADRGWATGAGYWLAAAGYPEIAHYSLADDADFNMKRLRRKFDRTDILASLIDSLHLPAYALVVVDPVSLFLGGNLLDYDACLVACHEIRAYLRLRRYTLLATAHSGKMKADKRERYVRTSDQILGTTAIPGFTDAVLHLASPEELGKCYYRLVWHPHCAKAEEYLLDRDEQGLFVPWAGADGGTQARVFSLVPENGAIIEFGSILEQAAAIPLSRRTVKTILDKLIEQGQVERVAHGQYRRCTVQ